MNPAEAYLEKPFNKEELLIRVQKLLELRKNLQQYYLSKAGLQSTSFVEIPDTAIEEQPENSFVTRVREVIEQHLGDPNLTVEQLSRLLFMSHSQLHRKLEALTGCSPNKFIRLLRLKKAMVLLQHPANSIATVAFDCGYNDPGYFGRIFKQEYKMTPQEWRAANTNTR